MISENVYTLYVFHGGGGEEVCAVFQLLNCKIKRRKKKKRNVDISKRFLSVLRLGFVMLNLLTVLNAWLIAIRCAFVKPNPRSVRLHGCFFCKPDGGDALISARFSSLRSADKKS